MLLYNQAPCRRDFDVFVARNAWIQARCVALLEVSLFPGWIPQQNYNIFIEGFSPDFQFCSIQNWMLLVNRRYVPCLALPLGRDKSGPYALGIASLAFYGWFANDIKSVPGRPQGCANRHQPKP